MASANPNAITLKIKRQKGPGKPSYWEEFEIPYRSGANVISLLMDIQKKPKTKSGKDTEPVAWDCNCLEEVCGACTMIVNGRVRQACTALIDNLEKPIRLEPMTKFPVVRDLMVDRKKMFEALKKVKAWIPIDGMYDLGPGPRMSQDEQQAAYDLSRCMTCGCCMEACPQYNSRSAFIGPAPISQARLFNSHPTGKMNKNERLEPLMGEGGVVDCGNAQNCVEACPKEIALTDSIGIISRQTTILGFQKLFNR